MINHWDFEVPRYPILTYKPMWEGNLVPLPRFFVYTVDGMARASSIHALSEKDAHSASFRDACAITSEIDCLLACLLD